MYVHICIYVLKCVRVGSSRYVQVLHRYVTYVTVCRKISTIISCTCTYVFQLQVHMHTTYCTYVLCTLSYNIRVLCNLWVYIYLYVADARMYVHVGIVRFELLLFREKISHVGGFWESNSRRS